MTGMLPVHVTGVRGQGLRVVHVSGVVIISKEVIWTYNLLAISVVYMSTLSCEIIACDYHGHQHASHRKIPPVDYYLRRGEYC